jgi:hypothetical protein
MVASGLSDYTSPYSARTVEGQIEELTDEELLRIRGESKRDDEVHAMISWTTREDYQLWIGTSIPIQDPVGGEYHEGQLWEEAEEQWIITQDHPEFVYTWLMNRLVARSSARCLPLGMPESIDEVTVEMKKDGKAGYILFTPAYSLATPMKKMDVQAVLEDEEGYMKVGMGKTYTVRMLAQEFWELTQRQWEFYPIESYRRWIDGSIIHKVTWDYNEYRKDVDNDQVYKPPDNILVELVRCTEINNIRNQGKLLQYWAWSQMPIEVGVLFPEVKRMIEYWMTITLQPVPGDDDPTIYLRVLKEAWMERLREISNGVAQMSEGLGDNFGVRVRYLYNGLRVWFAPTVTTQEGFTGPLAEEPCSKDKWYSWTDIMAFTHPTRPDDQVREEPTILFGPGSLLQEWYDDPEVQGGKIALI